MHCLFKASVQFDWPQVSEGEESALLPCAWKEKELEWLVDILSYQGGQVSRHLNERGKEQCGYEGESIPSGGNSTCRDPGLLFLNLHAKT